ncbi:techylectin-5A [Nephila pilipes]|uniref:Techylectin-5A n=1 Tax=Nephila pilipes TaxID=299642 RepID=A0A8X6NNI4_NEPPI|nr:techylectin-5A [Nephila pilipes]
MLTLVKEFPFPDFEISVYKLLPFYNLASRGKEKHTFRFRMIYIFALSLILSLSFSQVRGNVTSTCDQSNGSMSYLDVAMDMITKFKNNFPVCPTISQDTILKPADCEEVLRSGQTKSGVYTVWLRSRVTEDRQLKVFCDMDTDGGGWTVLQRRDNFNRPNDYFYKDWASYKKGFGDNEKDFWLGNDNIFALTNQRLYSIRFDLKAVDGERRYALYDTFWIDDEDHKYTSHISDYSGNTGDSMMKKHNNQKFSTKDQDNDSHQTESCSQHYKGGWWYGSCHDANLNGLYLNGTHKTFADGINWDTFRGKYESLAMTEMKIRPKNFRKR